MDLAVHGLWRPVVYGLATCRWAHDTPVLKGHQLRRDEMLWQHQSLNTPNAGLIYQHINVREN
jgi:hypothetical protein